MTGTGDDAAADMKTGTDSDTLGDTVISGNDNDNDTAVDTKTGTDNRTTVDVDKGTASDLLLGSSPPMGGAGTPRGMCRITACCSPC